MRRHPNDFTDAEVRAAAGNAGADETARDVAARMTAGMTTDPDRYARFAGRVRALERRVHEAMHEDCEHAETYGVTYRACRACGAHVPEGN